MVACLNAGRVVKNMRATRARVNDFFIFFGFSWGDRHALFAIPPKLCQAFAIFATE